MILYRRHVAATFCALMLLASVAISGVIPARVFAAGSDVFTLPVAKYYKDQASSSGSVVVWDTIATGETSEPSDIWGYDLSTKELFQVPIPAGYRGERPRISGDWILYEANGWEGSNWTQRVFCYDRKTGVTTQMAKGGDIRVSGDIAVWSNSTSSNVYGANLSTGETFTVSAAPGDQWGADVAGHWVVYADRSSKTNRADIKAYDIDTRRTKTLCNWTGWQYHPRISENGFVVWQHDPSNTRDPDRYMDLYGCNVDDGDIRRIAGGSGSQATPSIGGNLIAYFDSRRPGGYNMVGYDLLTGVRFGIAKSTATEDYVAGIHEGTIARLHREYHPNRTLVQLIWPTELNVIADDGPISESIDLGDEGLADDGFELAASGLGVPASSSSVPTVVVAPATHWPSIVVASSLAGRRSPLLLTSTASVPGSVIAKLRALRPEHVVVLGGPALVSEAAMAQLRSVVGSDSVSRFAGASTKERSLLAASVLAGQAGWSGTVLICPTGSASTAFSVVPASVRKGLPLILVDSKGLSAAQIAGLVSAGAKRFVVVGEPVPASTLSRLKNAVGSTKVTRILGTSTASTSAKFATWAVANAGLKWNRLGIASSSKWSRTPMVALTKGRTGSVLLVTNPKRLSTSVGKVLAAHNRSIHRADFAGKRSVVSNAARREVRLILK